MSDESPGAARSRSALAFVVLGALAFGMALLSAIVLSRVSYVLDDWRLDTRGVDTEANTTGSRSVGTKEEIRFQYHSKNGQTWTSKGITSDRQMVMAGRGGGKVPVTYDPKMPGRVRLKGHRLSKRSSWGTVSLGLALVGVASILFGLILRRKGSG